MSNYLCAVRSQSVNRQLSKHDGISSTVWSVCSTVPVPRGLHLSHSRSSADFTTDFVCHLLRLINRSFQASLLSSVREKDCVCAFTFVSLRSWLSTRSIARPWALLLSPFNTCTHTHIHTYILTWVLATLHAVILYGLFASLILLPHTVL